MYNTLTMISIRMQNRQHRDQEIAKIRVANMIRTESPFDRRLMITAIDLINNNYNRLQYFLDSNKITLDDLYIVADYISNIDPLAIDLDFESYLH